MRLIKGFLFIFILIGILGVLSLVISPSYYNSEKKVADRNAVFADILSEEKNTIDMLVLGDSESYTFYSPMELWLREGIPSYVCGQTGQRIPETYYMLKHVLKTQSPRLVVLETDTLFCYQGIVREMQTSLSELASWHLPVFRYHNLWKKAFEKDPPAIENYKGFTIRTGVRPYKGGEYMKRTEEREKIAAYVRIYLDGIRRLCEKKNSSLLLVSALSPSNYNYARHNAVHDYACEKGIPYLDLNLKQKEIRIDWKTDSIDAGDHLNLSGAHKVTEYLGKYLRRHYNFTDHRSEAAYQKWNEEGARYKEQAESALREMQAKSL